MPKKVLPFEPDPATDRIEPAVAKQLIREALRTGRFAFSVHAMRELAADRIETTDAVAVLRGGVVQEPEFENGTWRYRVQTNRMVVVIAFRSKDEIVVVTAWRTTT